MLTMRMLAGPGEIAIVVNSAHLVDVEVAYVTFTTSRDTCFDQTS